MKVVIIGGGAGGATAAARIRRLDEHAQIVMLERSGYISYANCGLPYYVGGTIEDEGELTLQTPESFHARFRVDVRVRHEAIAIDVANKAVRVRNLETGETYEEGYDRLVLAPGARPIVPPLPGVDSPELFTLRTVEDTLRIRRHVDAQHPRSATVIGGGFIGLEMAENLAQRGLSVTIVEKLEQLMSPLDADMASFVHAKFRKQGVRLALGSAVTAPRTEEGGGRAAEERRDYDEVYGHGRDVDEYNRRRPAPSRRVGQLEIRNLRLLDENRDGRIERGERCKLVFTLYNRGNRPVYNLTPLITSDERRIRFSPPATIADLYPGKGVRYTSVVYSDRKLKNGEAHFSIRILQGDREVRLCTFAVPTRR